jgi:aminoglycoside phosphotransferase (APT) family kinase protein
VDRPSVGADEVGRLARDALGAQHVRVARVPLGFGNENWRVTDAADRSYAVKVGPLASAGKWNSARVSYELAADAGVPVPRLVHLAEHGDHIVRIFEWIDGRSPIAIAADPECIQRLFTSLGSVVGRLHSIELDGFSSRLDGSAPSYRSWADYVGYRLEQIRGRCVDHGVPDAQTVTGAMTAITELAGDVDESARPALCHRDLYADNLVVDDHGALVAILDWDMAEAWDPAAEWFKLDWLLFPEFPNAEASFDAAYHAIHPQPARWEQRKQLVDLMETLNVIANATARGWDDFATRARARLDSLLRR